jgi:hypothetical protein
MEAVKKPQLAIWKNSSQELAVWSRSGSLVIRICRQRLTRGLGQIGSDNN